MIRQCKECSGPLDNDKGIKECRACERILARIYANLIGMTNHVLSTNEGVEADWLFKKIIEMLNKHLKNFKDTKKFIDKLVSENLEKTKLSYPKNYMHGLIGSKATVYHDDGRKTEHYVSDSRPEPIGKSKKAWVSLKKSQTESRPHNIDNRIKDLPGHVICANSEEWEHLKLPLDYESKRKE